MNLDEVDKALEASSRAARHGWRLGRLLLVSAVTPIALMAFLFAAAPNTVYDGPGVGDSVPTWLGVVGIAVGLVWMWRIHRADPEPDPRAWRYRAD
jgi:hypothetical protein